MQANRKRRVRYLLAVFCLAGRLNCGAEISTNCVLDHNWTFGHCPHRYGLIQVRYRATEEKPWVRRTELWVGMARWKTSIPAVLIAAIPISALASLAFFGITALARRRERKETS
jgi:hypothetical protein